jgi:hypothetical protein
VLVDTHATCVILLQKQDWIRQPIWIEHFHDEAGCKESGDLFTNGFPFLFCEAPQWLLDHLGIWPNMKRVLSQLPRHTWHVFWRPCEDVPILTEEADELAFLFGREAGADDDKLGWVALVQRNLLGIIGQLELLPR